MFGGSHKQVAAKTVVTYSEDSMKMQDLNNMFAQIQKEAYALFLSDSTRKAVLIIFYQSVSLKKWVHMQDPASFPNLPQL